MKMNLKNGYIALMTVFIISLVSMTIAISMLLSGVDMTKTSLSIEQSGRARGYANSCVEYGLELIRNNIIFSGSGSLSFSLGSCTYEVNNLGGTNREVRGIGISGNVTKRAKAVVVSLVPNLNVSSWQEVADF